MNKPVKFGISLLMGSVLLTGCWNPFVGKSPEPTPLPTPTISPAEISQIKQRLRQKTGLSVPSLPPTPTGQVNAPTAQSGTTAKELVLADQIGSGSTALVSWVPGEKVLQLAVLADLPDLQSGQFYQVWLQTEQGGSLPLGRLQSIKGGWSWQGQVAPGQYRQIMISRESVADNQIETIILAAAVN